MYLLILHFFNITKRNCKDLPNGIKQAILIGLLYATLGAWRRLFKKKIILKCLKTGPKILLYMINVLNLSKTWYVKSGSLVSIMFILTETWNK